MLRRERSVGQHVSFALIHQRSELWPAWSELVRDMTPDLCGTFLVGVGERRRIGAATTVCWPFGTREAFLIQ